MVAFSASPFSQFMPNMHWTGVRHRDRREVLGLDSEWVQAVDRCGYLVTGLVCGRTSRV